MNTFIVASVAGAALFFNAAVAEAKCSASISGVVGYDTAAQAWLTDEKARLNWLIGPDRGAALHTALQLTLAGTVVVTAPVQAAGGFRLGLCHDVNAALNFTLYGDFSWSFPGAALSFVAGGVAKIEGDRATLALELAGTWENWVYTQTGFGLSTEVPVGGGPAVVLVPEIDLTFASGTVTTAIGLTLVVPRDDASLLASASHTIGGGWSFVMGFELPLRFRQ